MGEPAFILEPGTGEVHPRVGDLADAQGQRARIARHRAVVVHRARQAHHRTGLALARPVALA